MAKAHSFVSLSAKEYVEEIFSLWGGRGLSRPLAPRLSFVLDIPISQLYSYYALSSVD